METKSGRSSKVSDRATPSSRISRPGSAVDLFLERISAFHVDTRKSMEAVHANLCYGLGLKEMLHKVSYHTLR